jgi:hypothetical protein
VQVPSSGFVSAVMERIEEECRAPMPIPFPWKRIMPGMALAAGVLGGGAFETIRHASEMTISFAPVHFWVASEGVIEAGWVALTIAASMLAWQLSCRLVGRAGLL